MKKKLLGALALGLSGLLAFGVGSQTNKPVLTKAEGESVRLYFHSGWRYNCHIAMYFYDDADHNGWSKYYTVNGDSYLDVAYDHLSFTPTHMSIMRYDNAYSQASWDSDKLNTSVWNSQKGLAFAEFAMCGAGDWATSAFPYIHSGGGGKAWGDHYNLDQIKYNSDSCHWEYYSTNVTLAAGEEMGVKIGGGGWYTTATYAKQVADKFEMSGSNIKCNTAGTYAFYFDQETTEIYVTSPALAAADEWAQSFLAGVTCDGAGSITKDEWTTLSGTYAALDADAKAIFTSIAEDGNDSGTYAEKAVCRYDYIVKKYGTTAKPDFMERKAAGKINPKATQIVPVMNDGKDSPLIITIAIGIVATVSVAGLFFIRRRHAE